MIQADDSLRKAAVLLASLDTATADALLRQMEAAQAVLLRAAMTGLGEIDPDEQARVAAEYFQAAPGATKSDKNNVPHVATYDRAAAAPGTANRERAFDFLAEPRAADLYPLLEREQPQTIALVVSHLPPDRAAEVIGRLPGDTQAEVLRRLVDLDETSPEVLHEVQRGLESRAVARANLLQRRAAGMNAVSNILAAADPSTKETIERHVARHDAALAQSLARAPLLFSDLVLLDDESLWKLLESADQEWVLLAMAGAPSALAQRVIELLPSAEAKDFRRALSDLGPTRLADVEEAQHRIAELACRMELEGALRVPAYRLGAVAA